MGFLNNYRGKRMIIKPLRLIIYIYKYIYIYFNYDVTLYFCLTSFINFLFVSIAN